jgi:hypothetical protein
MNTRSLKLFKTTIPTQHHLPGHFQAAYATKISAPAALLLASVLPGSALASVPIPTVVVTCATCQSYADLAVYAQNTAAPLIGVGITPSGFPAGQVSQPGFTKIVVSAKTVPRSFVFDYQATKHYVSTIGFYYYSYTVTPAGSLPATDTGAVSVDFQLYKALRVSGLPTITLPPNIPISPSTDWESLARYITTSVIVMVGVPTQSTLPGLLNWTFYPSIQAVYNGKKYTLYEGDTITVKFADGTTVDLKVQVATAMGTIGFLVVQKITPAIAPVSLTPPPAGSFTGATVSSPIDLNGLPISLITWTTSRSGSVFVGELITVDPSTGSFVPFTFEFDIG